MMERVFVDTGGRYAAIVCRNHDHEAAREFLSDNRRQLLTSDYVLNETVTLL